jgi:hypothetical protein
MDSKLSAGASEFLADELGAGISMNMCEFGAFKDDAVMLHFWHILSFVILQMLSMALESLSSSLIKAVSQEAALTARRKYGKWLDLVSQNWEGFDMMSR